jgi:folate-binding protein YgfZ
MTTVTKPEIHPETRTHSSQPQATAALDALLTAAATHPLSDIGWLRITGEDRVRWLNGMVTNSIQDLQPGQGNYNFLLSAQGRIQGDANIFAETEAFLLQSDAAQLPTLTTLLDRFIIMDDVELADISSTRTGLLLAGPNAPAILAKLNLPTTGLAPLQLKAIPWRGEEITLIHAHSPLVPRFELWAAPATIASLTNALHEAGATPVDNSALEQLRILEGTPRYGTDIRDKELPQETAPAGAQSRALHFNKGCYLGQEIVERIRSRGNVHRIFSSFRLEGALPAPGTLLEAEGKQIGELTSVTTIGTIQLALGYVRREALENNQLRNLPLTYPGGVAVPVATPFNFAAAN